MQYGSRNYLRQKQVLNRIYRKVKGARNHISHCLSKLLVSKYDLIVFEELKIKTLFKNSKLATSIHDAGWEWLILHTTYKAAEKGMIVEKVDPKNTSQVCSVCGKKKKANFNYQIEYLIVNIATLH